MYIRMYFDLSTSFGSEGHDTEAVIPGRTGASYDVHLHIGESIITIGSMDSGLVPRGAPRNDGLRTL